MTKEQLEDFIRNSNRIEDEHSEEAVEDSLKAWEFLKDKEVLTLEDIRLAHGIMMRRIDLPIAGKYRFQTHHKVYNETP